MKNDTYGRSVRSLRTSVNNMALLIGEPCPLFAQLCCFLSEFICALPAGNKQQAANLDAMTCCVLEATVMNITETIQRVQNDNIKDLLIINDGLVAIDSAMQIVKAMRSLDRDRVSALFAVVDVAMTSLRKVSNFDYPQLINDEGEVIGIWQKSQ